MREEAKTIGGLCLKVGDRLWNIHLTRPFQVVRDHMNGATTIGMYLTDFNGSDSRTILVYNKEELGRNWTVSYGEALVAKAEQTQQDLIVLHHQACLVLAEEIFGEKEAQEFLINPLMDGRGDVTPTDMINAGHGKEVLRHLRECQAHLEDAA